MLPYGRQEITDADVRAVEEVLRSDFLTQGPAVPKFEKAVAGKVGAKHAVAVNSATSALHIACLAVGLGPGDLLWTVPNSFVASANCGRYCGADVDFIDIDADDWTLSVPLLKKKLTSAKKAGRIPKILIPVHFGGQPTQQEAIWELAQEFGVLVIDDASHSIGASRRGELVGSGRWADITVFSFHPVKIITSGEGGMAVTNVDRYADSMGMLRTHGITREPRLMRPESEPGASDSKDAAWYYEQQALGFNYRMTDVQAALGYSQLARLEANVNRRNELAARYDDLFADLPLKRQAVRSENRSAYHLYVVRTLDDTGGKAHREIFDSLRRAGIGVNLHYMPIHLQPYYRGLGFSPGAFPESEAHGRTAISLPLYPALETSEQDRVAESLRAALN